MTVPSPSARMNTPSCPAFTAPPALTSTVAPLSAATVTPVSLVVTAPVATFTVDFPEASTETPPPSDFVSTLSVDTFAVPPFVAVT